MMPSHWPWKAIGNYIYGRDTTWPIAEMRVPDIEPLEQDANRRLMEKSPELLDLAMTFVATNNPVRIDVLKVRARALIDEIQGGA